MRIELELWKVECTEFESSTKNTPNFVFQFFNRKPTNSASKPINSPATKRFSTNKEKHMYPMKRINFKIIFSLYAAFSCILKSLETTQRIKILSILES